MVNRLDQQALVHFASDRGWFATVATFQNGWPGIEPQATLLLLRAVAFPALGGQDRPDFLFEELLLGRDRLVVVRVHLNRYANRQESPPRFRARIDQRRAKETITTS